jgi:hypothetical protein
MGKKYQSTLSLSTSSEYDPLKACNKLLFINTAMAAAARKWKRTSYPACTVRS